MASEMSFRELYDHLEGYISDPEQRWKTCMRVKRHIHDPNSHGGSGADQCYFEGESGVTQLSTFKTNACICQCVPLHVAELI